MRIEKASHVISAEADTLIQILAAFDVKLEAKESTFCDSEIKNFKQTIVRLSTAIESLSFKKALCATVVQHQQTYHGLYQAMDDYSAMEDKKEGLNQKWGHAFNNTESDKLSTSDSKKKRRETRRALYQEIMQANKDSEKAHRGICATLSSADKTHHILDCLRHSIDEAVKKMIITRQKRTNTMLDQGQEYLLNARSVLEKKLTQLEKDIQNIQLKGLTDFVGHLKTFHNNVLLILSGETKLDLSECYQSLEIAVQLCKQCIDLGWHHLEGQSALIVDYRTRDLWVKQLQRFSYSDDRKQRIEEAKSTLSKQWPKYSAANSRRPTLYRQYMQACNRVLKACKDEYATFFAQKEALIADKNFAQAEVGCGIINQALRKMAQCQNVLQTACTPLILDHLPGSGAPSKKKIPEQIAVLDIARKALSLLCKIRPKQGSIVFAYRAYEDLNVPALSQEFFKLLIKSLTNNHSRIFLRYKAIKKEFQTLYSAYSVDFEEKKRPLSQDQNDEIFSPVYQLSITLKSLQQPFDDIIQALQSIKKPIEEKFDNGVGEVINILDQHSVNLVDLKNLSESILIGATGRFSAMITLLPPLKIPNQQDLKQCLNHLNFAYQYASYLANTIQSETCIERVSRRKILDAYLTSMKKHCEIILKNLENSVTLASGNSTFTANSDTLRQMDQQFKTHAQPFLLETIKAFSPAKCKTKHSTRKPKRFLNQPPPPERKHSADVGYRHNNYGTF